jgi:uncharacterized DUF497 family protein
MEFEWDKNKNKLNIKKHNVSFAEASEIFDGPVLSWIDDRQDYGEARIISIGQIDNLIILVVVHTERHQKCRIISARKAKLTEREKFYEYFKKKT